MTDDDTARKLDLSPIQVMASALAAVSAAFFASWLGTAGTLIGAGVGSIVATVGAATYSYSLKRSAEAVRRRAAAVREASLLNAGLPRPGRSTATPTEQLEAIEEDEARQQPGFWQRLDPRRVSLPWGKVALASAAVMLVALVAITSFEGLTGRSLASILGDDDSGRTTVGNVVNGGGSTGTEDETPSDQPTQDETQDDTSTDEDDGSEPDVDPSPTVDPTPSSEPEPSTDPSPTVDPTPSSGTTPTAEPTTAP